MGNFSSRNNNTPRPYVPTTSFFCLPAPQVLPPPSQVLNFPFTPPFAARTKVLTNKPLLSEILFFLPTIPDLSRVAAVSPCWLAALLMGEPWRFRLLARWPSMSYFLKEKATSTQASQSRLQQQQQQQDQPHGRLSGKELLRMRLLGEVRKATSPPSPLRAKMEETETMHRAKRFRGEVLQCKLIHPTRGVLASRAIPLCTADGKSSATFFDTKHKLQILRPYTTVEEFLDSELVFSFQGVTLWEADYLGLIEELGSERSIYPSRTVEGEMEEEWLEYAVFEGEFPYGAAGVMEIENHHSEYFMGGLSMDFTFLSKEINPYNLQNFGDLEPVISDDMWQTVPQDTSLAIEFIGASGSQSSHTFLQTFEVLSCNLRHVHEDQEREKKRLHRMFEHQYLVLEVVEKGVDGNEYDMNNTRTVHSSIIPIANEAAIAEAFITGFSSCPPAALAKELQVSIVDMKGKISTRIDACYFPHLDCTTAMRLEGGGEEEAVDHKPTVLLNVVTTVTDGQGVEESEPYEFDDAVEVWRFLELCLCASK